MPAMLCCYNCEHCIYIGEGDYICDENNEIVIEDWMPTDDYVWCNGKSFISIEKGGEG